MTKALTYRITCTGENCEREPYCRGLCTYHYNKLMRDPNRQIAPLAYPCKKCDSPVATSRTRTAALCQECGKEWRWCKACDAPWATAGYQVKKNVFTLPCPMHVRDEQLKVRLGITLEQYSDLLRAQGGTCAIAGCDERDNLGVDHDHRCCPDHSACRKCIRGLICARHNHALGKVRDSIAELEALARYLASFHSGYGGHR